MLIIYYKKHKKRVREGEFFNAISAQFPNAQIINRSYTVEQKPLGCLINTGRVIKCLRDDNFLPIKRRDQCIAILKSYPSQLKVALDPSGVSFDIVIEQSGKPYYWEFHEQQHRRLKDSRMKKLFTPDNSPICVPRYLQRLVRDIWRIQNFRPYTIVWYDWFSNNRNNYMASLSEGFHEFCISDQFSFKRFCQVKDC